MFYLQIFGVLSHFKLFQIEVDLACEHIFAVPAQFHVFQLIEFVLPNSKCWLFLKKSSFFRIMNFLFASDLIQECNSEISLLHFNGAPSI